MNARPSPDASYRSWRGPTQGSAEATWPGLLHGIAQELVALGEKLDRVMDARCGSGLLVQTLRALGVNAIGSDVSREAIDNVPEAVQPYCHLRKPSDPYPEKYSLVVSINPVRHLAEADLSAYFRTIFAAADSVLYIDTSEAVAQSAEGVERLLQTFAGYGFAPDISFQLQCLTGCVIMTRRKPALPMDVMRLFAQSLVMRHRLDSMQFGSNAVDAARLKERAVLLEDQLAREREYLGTLRGVHAHLLQEVHRLREEGRATTPRATAPVDIDALLARVRSEISIPAPAASIAGYSQLAEENAAAHAHISRLERRLNGNDQAITEIQNGLRQIVQSRIWRSLVSASGILLRITGRAPSGT